MFSSQVYYKTYFSVLAGKSGSFFPQFLVFVFFDKHYSININIAGIRHLFTAEALGLNSFLAGRERGLSQINGEDMKENFRLRMQDIIKPENTSAIFTDDLKTMINIADGSPRDFHLLSEMVLK